MIPPERTNAAVQMSAREYLAKVPVASVHLIVTSPPYNVATPYPGYEDAMPWEDYWNLMEAVASLSSYVLVPGGRLCVNWPGYALGTADGHAHHHRFAHVAEEAGFTLLAEIVWDQLVSGHSCQWGSWRSPSAPRFYSSHEIIQVWGKGTKREDRSGPSDVAPEEFAKWTRSIWKIPGGRDPLYPAVFPARVPRRLIKLFTWPGERVLDPFCGSGTTLVVARRLGRTAMGCDVCERAVELTNERLRDEALTLTQPKEHR